MGPRSMATHTDRRQGSLVRRGARFKMKRARARARARSRPCTPTTHSEKFLGREVAVRRHNFFHLERALAS